MDGWSARLCSNGHNFLAILSLTRRVSNIARIFVSSVSTLELKMDGVFSFFVRFVFSVRKKLLPFSPKPKINRMKPVRARRRMKFFHFSFFIFCEIARGN
jgi:hypothetical protein